MLRKQLKINLIFSAPTGQIKNNPPLNPKPGQTSAKNSRLSSNSIIEFYEPSLSQFYCELRFLVVVVVIVLRARVHDEGLAWLFLLIFANLDQLPIWPFFPPFPSP